MIGLDTSVVIAFLVGDHGPAKTGKIRALLSDDDETFYLSLLVLHELVGVLGGRRKKFRRPRDEVARIVRGFLGARNVVVAEAEAVDRALARYEDGFDFADMVIVETGRAASCLKTLTLDKRASAHPDYEYLS